MMLLTFALDDWKCAIDISVIEKTYRAAALTPLPEAPEVVQGIVNIRGSILPAVSLRRRFSLPEKEISPDDHFVVASMPSRQVVLVVDDIGGVIDCIEQDIVSADDIFPALAHVEGVLRLKDSLVLIQDLTKLLSIDEDLALGAALEAA